MAVGAISLAVFFTLAVTGNATVAALVITEGLAMGIVIALWVRACARKASLAAVFSWPPSP